MEINDNQPGGSQLPGANRNIILVVGGLFLLGLALALLLFGGKFGNDVAGEGSASLPQVPAGADEAAAEVGGIDPLFVGEKAHDFSLPGLDGNEVSLSELSGQPVIINFWATWCAPCRLEMPELQKTYEEHQDQDLVILAINEQEQTQDVRDFFDEMGFTFTPLLDSEGEVGRAYGMVGLPSTFFINTSGEVAAVHRGILTGEQIDTYLTQILP